MSIVTEKFLICDRCGELFGIDNRRNSGCVHRRGAKEEGWVIRGHNDYCPNCKNKYIQRNPVREKI